MKTILMFLAASTFLQAAPVVRDLGWRPACDGAGIKVVVDGGKILGVTASAAHFAVMIEWSIHYIDGVPVTAEFRESEFVRAMEGPDAGMVKSSKLKRLLAFQAEDGEFTIADEALSKELAEVLSKVKKEG